MLNDENAPPAVSNCNRSGNNTPSESPVMLKPVAAVASLSIEALKLNISSTADLDRLLRIDPGTKRGMLHKDKMALIQRYSQKLKDTVAIYIKSTSE